MTECPEVRKAILANMAQRLQKMQSTTFQQEKMAALGTLAAGLMHELNNPGAAARIQTPMILGLALIESLVLFALVIAFMLVGKIAG